MSNKYRKIIEDVLRINGNLMLPCRSCKNKISINTNACVHCGNSDPHCLREFSEKCVRISKKINWIARIGFIITICCLCSAKWLIAIISLVLTAAICFFYKKMDKEPEVVAFSVSHYDDRDRQQVQNVLYDIFNKIVDM